MGTELASLVCGGALLYLGAEWLVAGAAGIALALRVPQLVVGLTIVAYGTSAPEVFVGIEAALAHQSDVALGNVIGSNIANLGLILGLSVLICPPRVNAALARRDVPALLATTLLLPAVLAGGSVTRPAGGILLLLTAVYTVWTVRSAPSAAEPPAAAAPARSVAGLTGRALLGLAVLVAGAHLFLNGATQLALSIGISERVVGLTIVAVGTSLPELATSVIAALRGHSDIAVGNVVGSNIVNVLFCLGSAALAQPLSADPATLGTDLAVLAGMTLLGALSMRSARTIERAEGAVLLGSYLLFLLYLAR